MIPSHSPGYITQLSSIIAAAPGMLSHNRDSMPEHDRSLSSMQKNTHGQYSTLHYAILLRYIAYYRDVHTFQVFPVNISLLGCAFLSY